MKPKLLVLTSTFPRWKNDTDPPFVYDLSSRLSDYFYVCVHAPHYPGAKAKESMDGINVHRFRYFFSPFEKLAGSTGMLPTLRRNRLYYGLVPFFMTAQFFSLLLLMRRFKPDVIHAHWLVPQGFWAIVVKKFFDVPVVVTAHGADIFGLQHWLFLNMKQYTITSADAVTVVSKVLSERIVEIDPSVNHPAIIPMGVDPKVFNPATADKGIRKRYGINGHLLLYVGRLTEKKGVRYLIDAMPTVLRSHSQAKLLIVGNGELGGDLRIQVKRLALDRQVLFAGSIPNLDLPAYYATADLFVGPSIHAKGGDAEGFGLTFVEAAMSGCLVIGTTTGGIKDIIQENETGFLVPEKNVEALAAKIIYALGHEREVTTLKKTCRNRCIEKYSWKVITKQYEAVFMQCIDSRH